jgi:hypothetical protein
MGKNVKSSKSLVAATFYKANRLNFLFALPACKLPKSRNCGESQARNRRVFVDLRQGIASHGSKEFLQVTNENFRPSDPREIEVLPVVIYFVWTRNGS